MSDAMAVVEDILGMPTKLAGIIENLPEAQYHARGELSSTGARRLLESPAKFRWAQTHPVFKDTFDVGSAIHSKVMGTGTEIDVFDFDDWRTKAAREAKAESHAAGRAPLLAKDMPPINDAAEAVLSNPVARMLFEQDGSPEASVFTECRITGVPMRARFDYLAPIAVDLKTSADASPKGFAKSVANFGYDVQEAWYKDAHEFVTGERPRFVFVVVEPVAPYLVATYQLSREFRDMGEVKALAARNIYQQCLEKDEWPGYSSEIEALAPPQFAIYDYMEAFES